MFVSRVDFLKILKEFKEKNAEQYGILVLGIFGSVARNQNTKGSDIDVFLKMIIPDSFNIVHIKEELEQQLDEHIDIVRLRDTMNPYLKKRLERDAIYV